MSKNFILIGGVDSFGVPYTRDNKKHINHLSEVYNFLVSKKIDVSTIDMYSMHKYNDTDYMNYLLNSEISLYEIKENQIKSIDLCRKCGIFQFIQLPKKTKNLYKLNDEDRNRTLTELIKNNNTIFIYSCGINDFLKIMNTDLAKLLNPKNMEKAFNNIDQTISTIMNKIDNNLNQLIKINENIEIYIMGLYIPTRVRYIRNTVKKPISLYNEKLRKLCEKYSNTIFIDNINLEKANMAHVDWHPNFSGQRKMGENIITQIKENSKLLVKKK